MNKQFNSMRYALKFRSDKKDKLRIKKILDMIGTNKEVLDVGCGDGFIMEQVRAASNEVIGVEIGDNAIRRARKKGFKVFDLDLNTNWANTIHKKFDVVLAGEIIEHVFDTDKFLHNIRRVLKDEGVLVITTPNLASLGRRVSLFFGISPYIETTARKSDAGHVRYFTRKTLLSLVEENGFKINRVESIAINLDPKGFISSRRLAVLFPRLGNNIILKATKQADSYIKIDKPLNFD